MTTNKKVLLAIIVSVIIFFVFLGKMSNQNVFEAQRSILDDGRLIVQPRNGLEEKEILFIKKVNA